MANKRSILVVDDEVNVAETMKMVLEQEGYRVTAAYTAAAAITALRHTKFSAVITDLNMEKQDVGLEVVRAAQDQTHKPLIVVCTGYPTVQNLHSAFDLHIDHVAIKPCEIRDLLLAIHRLFASQERGNQRKATTGFHVSRPARSYAR
jgi:two-component system alkaline phosphatase synthesis response regulator PhoP